MGGHKNKNVNRGADNDATSVNVEELNINPSIIKLFELLISTSEKGTEKVVNNGIANSDKLFNVLKDRLDSDRLYYDGEFYKLNDRIDILLKDNQALTKRAENAEAKVVTLEQQLRTTDADIDDLEQSNRNAYLVVNNLPHETNTTDEQAFINLCENRINIGAENVSLIKSKISNVHRFSNKKQDTDANIQAANNVGRPRPLVVKFTDPKYRDIVYKKKKALKNSGIVITEFLTRKRSALLKACFDSIPGKNEDRSIWTDNGRILVKLAGKENIVHIKDGTDLKSLLLTNFPGTATVV